MQEKPSLPKVPQPVSQVLQVLQLQLLTLFPQLLQYVMGMTSFLGNKDCS